MAGTVARTTALLFVLAIFPVAASAMDADLADLEQRLARQSPEAVNTFLGNERPSALAELNQGTARCELPAVSLAVRLSRGGSARVVEAHRDALRTALGDCPGFVLALLAPREVPRICASVASWTLTQTARELRRRMRNIDADEVLRTSPRGKACRAAMLYELQNTRVGLRIGASPPVSGPR